MLATCERGTGRACARRMGVHDFQDLVCWQLSNELEREVSAFTATGLASRDFKFRDQVRGSSASAPANISEGFGRYLPGDFATFLRYAKGSLRETQNHLIHARQERYIEERLYSRLMNLARAAEKTTTALMLQKLRQAAKRRERPSGHATTRKHPRA